MVGLLGGKMNPNVAIILLTYLNSEERKRYPAQTIQGINQITLHDGLINTNFTRWLDG
jgi:hypothetical protein